ncbi:MAG: PqqD family protein [Elusimicrobia bacterium]|nr:PqqD family protein [Elusimicrobiota bacterium]
MAKRSKNGTGFKHARHVAWRKVADEAVILDLDTAQYYSLAGPGLRAWELLISGRSPAAAAAALDAEFEAPPGRIAADVAELLAALKKEGLLEPA